jgi:hypothetical protein
MSFISNYVAKDAFHPAISSSAPVRNKSSTYNTKINISNPTSMKYNLGSTSLLVKPILCKYPSILEYHAHPSKLAAPHPLSLLMIPEIS